MKPHHRSRIGERPGALAGAIALAAGVAGAALAVAGAPEAADIAPRGAVQGRFVLNLLSFVEWPEGTFESEQVPLVLGICGPQPREAFAAALRGRAVAGRKIAIRHCRALGELTSCHVLLLCPSRKDSFPEIVQHLGSRSVLVLSEIDGFAAMGGTVGFRVRGGGVEFEVNTDSARRARLKISSKLLKLAKAVHGTEAAGKWKPRESTRDGT